MKRTYYGLASIALVVAALFLTSQAVHADPNPADAAPGSSLDQRLTQRKQERAIVLTTIDQNRLVNTCASAQGKLRSLEVGLVSSIATRSKVYRQIDAKVWVTIGQLKLANKDTFVLEKDRLAFADKTANFQTISANLTQAINDTELINCKADPVGFKALLETDRLYYSELQKQVTDSHDFVVNTIKPEITSNVADLQPKTPTSGNN